MNRVQSTDHNIGSYRIDKICLSPCDDKKDTLKDGHNRLSHIHRSTH